MGVRPLLRTPALGDGFNDMGGSYLRRAWTEATMYRAGLIPLGFIVPSISSPELGKALGITQKSAWFMLQRLRLALQDKRGGTLGGPGGKVEVDETFIGGKARNMHKWRRNRMHTIGKIAAKTAVMGLLERGGQVRAHVIGQRSADM
jgi:hypothetical protein